MLGDMADRNDRPGETAGRRRAGGQIESMRSALNTPIRVPRLAVRGANASGGGEAGERRPLSVSARLGALQFHRSGKFRILQLSDIQDGPTVSPDTISLIAAACDAARPDLVVLTGDQIAGYHSAYHATFRARHWNDAMGTIIGASRSAANFLGDAMQGFPEVPAPDGSARAREQLLDEKARQAATRQASRAIARQKDLARTRDLVRGSIHQFMAPIVERGIPFAVTYGNHDFQCGLDNAEFDAIFRELPGCLNPETLGADPTRPVAVPASLLPAQRAFSCAPGTFALPVMDVDRTRTVIGVTLIDSGDYARGGGYGTPSQDALDFLRVVPRVMGAKSIVFQHIPLPQFYDLLREVPPTTAYAVQGYRTYDGATYLLDESRTLPGSYLGEGVSCPDTDCGQFQIMKDTDGYFALFAGHDHRNGFVGADEGIILGATPTCGFGAYGPVPRMRAARLFEFDIRHPYNPRTQLLQFGDLVGKPTTRRVYTYAMSHVPVSAGDTWNLLRRPSVWGGIVAAATGVLASALFGGKGDGGRR